MMRVFADRMCLLQTQSYPKRDEQEPLSYYVDVQAYLSFAGLTIYCRFCHAMAQINIKYKH